jgi:hypothetical protein
MGDLNNYICDKSNKLLDKVELEKLYKQLRLDLTVGDIIWHHDQLSSASENPSAMKLIQDIEAHLFENNKNFTRFPSDYIHGLMSRDVYRNHVFNPDDETKLSDVEELKTTGWRLLKVFNEPSEDTLIYKKGEIYSGVIYWNESRRQMVLAHRGIDAKFTSYFKEDGTLCTNIEGIIVGKIVPQLAICYDITDQANEQASEKGCYLSFTGYANGAWLAEYSNYFSNLYLNNQNTRGVLFESPGIFRDEHEVDSNIVKRGNKFDLCNLNIVNYLTEPCFSNSLNKHVGQAYRLFIYSDEEEEKLKKSLLNNLKKIPLVGEKLKKCKFLLNGLLSMFYHGRLTRIIEKFDSKTGNLKSSEREDSEEILNWPLVKFSLDKKYKGNLKKLSKKPLEKLIKIIPIPSFIKKPAGFIVNEALAWTTDFILEKSIPGLHLIANILIELCSGNIDVTHFENPSFYLRISELRKIKSESSKGPENKNVKEKSKAKVESTEFTLKIKGEYVTIERYEKKQRLLISNSTQNIDWCLDKLESVALDKNNLSKIVYKSLDDLKGLFSTEISLEGNDDKQCKFIIVKESKNEVTIDILKERMIKLLKINPNIRKELKFQMPTSSLVHITHFLNERIPFIGREEIIKKIKEKFEQITTRILVLQAFGGMGKSCLANEYGHIIKDEDRGYVVRWLVADKKDNFKASIHQIARLFNIPTVEKQDFNELLDFLMGKIKDSPINFLFILDNVENIETIQSFVSQIEVLKKNKIQLLITTRQGNLIEQLSNACLIQVNSFGQVETELYFEKFLKAGILNKPQKTKLTNLVKLENRNGESEILPLKIKLTVNYINKNLLKNKMEIILDEIERDNKPTKEVQEYFLKKLPREQLNLLVYCSFFDPNFISLDLLNTLFNDIVDSLECLSNDGLIDIDRANRGIKLHNLVQNEVQQYLENNSNDFDSKAEILNKIMTILNENSTNISNVTSNNDENASTIEQEYMQLKTIWEFIDSKLKQNMKIETDKKQESDLLNKLGNYFLWYEIQYEKALEFYLKCFEMRSNLYKGDHPDLAQSLNNLGVSYTSLGDDNKALEFYSKCFEMRSNLYKGDHPDLAQSLNNLGVSYTRLGDDNKALEFYLKCFEMRSNLYKGDHPDLAQSLNNLGVSYTRLGDDNKALEFDLKCFEMRSNLYKGDHPDIAQSLNSLGVSYTRLGNDNKALKYNLKCFEMRSNLYKGDHPDIAQSLNSLGVSYERLGDDNKANEYFSKCFEMRSKLYKGDHPYLAQSLNSLGVSYKRLGDDNKALEFDLKCFEMRSNLYKSDHPDLAESLNSLGVSYGRLGDDNKALEFYLKCFEMRSNLYKGDHPDLAQSLNNLGVSYTRLGDDNKALEFYLKCFEMRSNLYKGDHPD